MKKILFLFIPLLIFTVTFLQAQEQGNKIVIINLKNGYAVKGTIVEQNDKLVKIKVQDGQILEYSTTEIESVLSRQHVWYMNKLSKVNFLMLTAR